MVDYKVLDLEFKGPNPLEVSKALGVTSDTIAEWYAGYTDTSNDLIDITGNGRSLADTGGPVVSNTILVNHENNPIKEFVLNGTTQCFSKAHEGWMNRFSVDFAMTFVLKSPAAAPVAAKTFFCHGETIVSGIYAQMDTSGYYKVYLSKAGSSVNAVLSTNMADGYYHVIHINRSSTSVNIYVDGVAGTPADPSTFGIDVSEIMYLGSYRGPANYWPSGWIYARLQRYALSTDRITQEVQYWKGIWAGAGGRQLSASATFTRPVASYAGRDTGANSVIQTNPNWPVKTPDGGMLVQGDVAQVLTYTDVFDNAVWATNYYSGVNKTASGNRSWYDNATDTTGQYIYGCVRTEYLYVSADSGVSFTEVSTMGSQAWRGISCDPTGQHVVACTNGGKIFTSHDYGVTFVEKASVATNFVCICLGVGGRGACGTWGAKVYLTSDNGDNWVLAAGAPASKVFACICCDMTTSAIMFAWLASTGVYKSTDFGATWNQVLSAGYSDSNSGIACSTTGQYVVASLEGAVCVSNNYGTFGTWAFALTGTFFGGAAGCSSTGQYMAIGKNAGNNTTPIWTSIDYGVNWTERSNIGLKNWKGISFFGTSFYACGGDLTYQILCSLALLDTVASSSATPLAPDGTATYKLVAGVNDSEHGIIQAMTLTAAYYIFEVDVTTGDKNWVYIADQTVSNAYAYFNTSNGVLGTTGAGCTASIYNRSGRRRCAICVLGTAATHTFQISPAASDGVLAFAGDGATPNVYVWEASCHLGKFQTLPVTRTTGAVTRSADTLTYPSTFIPGYFIGNSYHNKSLIIEVKVKCQYTDTNNIGVNTYRPFLTIGGNTGTATATRNHISLRAYNQYVYAHFYGSAADTEHYMRHTVADANKWHVYRLKLNFTTLSSSTFTKDDTPFTPGEVLNMDASPYNFDATNCLLRIGQTYAGTVSGFCEIAYVKIWVGT